MVPRLSLTHSPLFSLLFLAFFCFLSFDLVPKSLKEDRASRSLAKTGSDSICPSENFLSVCPSWSLPSTGLSENFARSSNIEQMLALGYGL